MCMHMLPCLPLLDTSAMSEFESFETVAQWLHVLHLEQYTAEFQRAGLATLHQCHSLTADQLECMGITLPGHRRRILASLIKMHGIGQLQPIQLKKTQCLAQTGHDKAWPGSIPREENSICKEREKNYEKLSPSLRTRQKPVPRERQVSRIKEESGDVAEHKPMPRPRQMPRRTGKTNESGGEMEHPVPKERTRFSINDSVKSSPSTFDTSLPSIPPRRTLNCPPVCFIPHLNPTAPNPTPVTHELKRRASAQGRIVTQSLILRDQTADKPVPSSQTQTLPIQPLTGHLSRDGVRKTPGASIDIQVPPLPPKVGVLSNCQPPISWDILAQPPTAHR